MRVLNEVFLNISLNGRRGSPAYYASKTYGPTYMPDFAKTLGGHGVLSSLDDL